MRKCDKKNMVQPYRPHMTIQYGACVCMRGNYSYRPTISVCNTYCFSTATIDAPRRYVTRTMLLLLELALLMASVVGVHLRRNKLVV